MAPTFVWVCFAAFALVPATGQSLVPFDSALQDNNVVDVGYSFREKHVRMSARRNTGTGKQRYRDPKSSQTWVYDQSRGRDWLRHAWWEDSPEARQVL